MYIARAIINNFMAIGHADISLHNKGLIALCGINNDDDSADSNGSGKTSLPQAIFWCLYGALKAGQRADEVVNQVAGKDTSVQLEIQDNKNTYLIERYRKHVEHKNGIRVFVNGMEQTGTDTQEIIVKLLGCEEEVFKAIVYAAQKDMVSIPSLTDKGKKVLLEKAAGMESLELAAELARADFKKTSLEIETNQQLLKEVEIVLEGCYKRLDREEELKAGFADTISQRVNEVRDSKIDISKRIEEIEANESKFDKELYESLERELSDAQNLAGSRVEKEEALQTKLQELKDIRDGYIRNIVEINVYSEGKRLDIGRMELLDTCFECGRPYEDAKQAKLDYDNKKANLEIDIETKESSLPYIQGKLDSVNGSLIDLRQEIRLYMEQGPKMGHLNDRLDLQADYAKQDRLRKEEIENLETEYSNLDLKIENIKKEKNPYVDLIVAIQQETTTHINDRLKYERLVADSEKTAAKQLKAIDVLSPKGCRAHMLDTITPYLNEKTNDYLSTLTDGNIIATWTTLTRKKDGELAEKFTIDIETESAASSYASLSGGEQKKVDLACYLALQDLAASRAEKSIDLYMCDEIDDAVDPAGLERLFQLLELKAREKGTGLIISHNDLSSWVRESATMTKTDGQATISGDLDWHN